MCNLGGFGVTPKTQIRRFANVNRPSPGSPQVRSSHGLEAGSKIAKIDLLCPSVEEYITVKEILTYVFVNSIINGAIRP